MYKVPVPVTWYTYSTPSVLKMRRNLSFRPACDSLNDTYLPTKLQITVVHRKSRRIPHPGRVNQRLQRPYYLRMRAKIFQQRSIWPHITFRTTRSHRLATGNWQLVPRTTNRSLISRGDRRETGTKLENWMGKGWENFQ